jgi:hypothetical protein
MPEYAFKDGYLAGWKWIRGNDEMPTIPACSVPDEATAYRAGIMRGVRDACVSPERAKTESVDTESILNRAPNNSV